MAESDHTLKAKDVVEDVRTSVFVKHAALSLAIVLIYISVL